MNRIKVRTVPRKRHPMVRSQARSFNFVSGFIYAGAVIAAITLGALFYKGYREAEQQVSSAGLGSELAGDLPPGARVITKSGRPKIVAPPASRPAPPSRPGAHPSPPALSEEAEAEEDVAEAGDGESAPLAPAVAESASAEEDWPSLKPLPRSPWSSSYSEMLLPQQKRLIPSSLSSWPALSEGSPDGLPLKGNEAFILARLDVSDLRGWTLKRVVWHARIAKGAPRDVSFSSLSSDWDDSTGVFRDGVDSTWLFEGLEEVPQTAPWPGRLFIRGNGGSLVSYGRPAETNVGPGQWISVEVDPRVLQTLVSGNGYGIAIADEKGQLNSIASILGMTEPSSSPYFDVEGGVVDVVPPGQISDLRAYAHPDLARRESVGMLLTWTATGDDAQAGQAFRYDIRYGVPGGRFEEARPLPVSKTPWPQPAGQKDQVVLEGLDPGARYVFYVRAVDESGQGGPISRVESRTGDCLPLVASAPPAFFDADSIEVASRAAGFWILDEMASVNPQSGQVADRLPGAGGAAATKSMAWDRASRTLHLKAAKNETIGFQMVFQKKEGAFPELAISAEPFTSSKGNLAQTAFSFFRTWYGVMELARGVKAWVGDALVPLDRPLSIPWEGNLVPGQSFQTVYTELKIPASAMEGLYRSTLVIKNPAGIRDTVNVLLEVLPPALPARPSFVCELLLPPTLSAFYRRDISNSSDAGPIERLYQELAAEHRCASAFLPYAPNGNCPQPFGPASSGLGQEWAVRDWKEWDLRFGPMLTAQSSAFFVLPIFENWPVPFGDGYLCKGDDLRQNGTGYAVYGGVPETLEACFSSPYWRTFRSALQQFGEHLRVGGWNQVPAGLWLVNNPVSNYTGRAPAWSFGRPLYRDDFLALDAYARFASTEAASSWTPGQFKFRVSVPEAAWLAEHGGARFSLLSSSDPTAEGWALLRARAQRHDSMLWRESATAPLFESPLAIYASAIFSYLEGADGWSIREAAGLPVPWARVREQNLMVCGAPLGEDKPFPSMRLKSLRRAQQDIELLALLGAQKGWSRLQVKEYVLGFLARQKEAGRQAQDWALLRKNVRDLLADKTAKSDRGSPKSNEGNAP